MLENYQRVYAAVDLSAVLYNMERMHETLSPQTEMIGVIKTDGYGHGAVPIGRELEKLSYVFGYATATAEEAFILRRAGLEKPVLVLGYTFPYSYEKLILQKIRPAVFSKEAMEALDACAARLNKKAPVHVKVDTGMSRIGIRPDEEGLAFMEWISSLSHIEVEGIFTHFARADERDQKASLSQLARFTSFAKEAERRTDSGETLFQQRGNSHADAGKSFSGARGHNHVRPFPFRGSEKGHSRPASCSFSEKPPGLCEGDRCGNARQLRGHFCVEGADADWHCAGWLRGRVSEKLIQ